jgi:glycosyltransferase involved in cell wall biosynthesis
MTPTISVVLPTCERPQFLAATLASVAAQTFGDFELIIADDGSGEETRALLRRLAPGAHLIFLGHRGNPGAARNAALREARGRYVAFIDSDDLWKPDKTARQLAELGRATDCRWCYTAFERIDAQGRPLAADVTRPFTPHRGAILRALIDGGASLRTPSVLAERGLLVQAGGFDESLRSCEDYDLWMRLAALSPVALVDAPMVSVRLNDSSHSNRSSQLFLDREASLRKLAAAPDAALRMAVRRARARNSLQAAARLREQSGRAAALRHLGGAMSFAWREPRWWPRAMWLSLGAG